MSLALPKPKFPFVSTIVTMNPETSETIKWVVGKPHPLMDDLQVVRMFIGESDVDIYSIASDGRGMRNTVPKFFVRMTEEIMPFENLISEIQQAEDPDDDDDDEEEEEEEPSAAAPSTSSGSQSNVES